MLPDLIALDTVASGVARPAYLGAWFTDTATRRTLVLVDSGEITGVGTIRTCREGHKVGPLIAPTAAEAESLLRALAAAFGTRSILIDTPESNEAALAMARHLGFEAGVRDRAHVSRRPAQRRARRGLWRSDTGTGVGPCRLPDCHGFAVN